MQAQRRSNRRGFRLGSILLHSLWITIVGLAIIRLATANTESVIQVEVFAVLGVILATSPWLILLLVSTTIISLYKAEVYDFTWLVRLPEDESCCSVQGPESIYQDCTWLGRFDVESKTLVRDQRAADPRLKRNLTF